MHFARCINPRLALALGLTVLAFAPLRAQAADLETRVFTISVDGKKSGDYTLAIQSADGAFAVSASSEVRVTVLGVTMYSYSYHGREHWQGDRLVKFECGGKEKGKAFSVRADVDGNALRVVANGKQGSAAADSWMTSCWKLPAADRRNGAVPMIGCDNGNQFQGRLEFVGNEQVKVAGQAQTYAHYRVTKDVPHDVWYDASDRIVRDEWTSGGHKTVMEMTELRR